MNRLVARSPKAANRTRRRTCSVCGDPLGSTEALCHDCGGRSFRGVRNRSPVTPIPRAARAAIGQLFGGGR